MADIQVRSAFVDKVLTGANGAWGLKTSEPHSRKNDHGGYDTTGRTFRTLRGKNVDWSQFQERDRVAFFGREETIEREHEGKKFYDLIVWVDGVMVHRSEGNSAERAQDAAGAPQMPNGHPYVTPTEIGPQNETWAVQGGFDSETPF